MPKKTLVLCEEKGYDVILKVKGNQRNLLRHIKSCEENTILLDEHYMKEKNRGRTEMRKLELYPFSEYVDKSWQNMNVVIKLTRSGTRGGKDYKNENFYISNLCEDAEAFQTHLRGYWGIENKVHYVKDVVFEQDKNRITKENKPANVSIINGFCLSVLRRKCGNSITTTRQTLANNPNKICELFE